MPEGDINVFRKKENKSPGNKQKHTNIYNQKFFRLKKKNI